MEDDTMTAQQERLQAKMDRLQKRIDEEKRLAKPIGDKDFEAKAFPLPDGTMAAPVGRRVDIPVGLT